VAKSFQSDDSVQRPSRQFVSLRPGEIQIFADTVRNPKAECRTTDEVPAREQWIALQALPETLSGWWKHRAWPFR
jgi:hypothetical protein